MLFVIGKHTELKEEKTQGGFSGIFALHLSVRYNCVFHLLCFSSCGSYASEGGGDHSDCGAQNTIFLCWILQFKHALAQSLYCNPETRDLSFFTSVQGSRWAKVLTHASLFLLCALCVWYSLCVWLSVNWLCSTTPPFAIVPWRMDIQCPDQIILSHKKVLYLLNGKKTLQNHKTSGTLSIRDHMFFKFKNL